MTPPTLDLDYPDATVALDIDDLVRRGRRRRRQHTAAKGLTAAATIGLVGGVGAVVAAHHGSAATGPVRVAGTATAVPTPSPSAPGAATPTPSPSAGALARHDLFAEHGNASRVDTLRPLFAPPPGPETWRGFAYADRAGELCEGWQTFAVDDIGLGSCRPDTFTPSIPNITGAVPPEYTGRTPSGLQPVFGVLMAPHARQVLIRTPHGHVPAGISRVSLRDGARAWFAWLPDRDSDGSDTVVALDASGHEIATAPLKAR